jgi:hypothetical protein
MRCFQNGPYGKVPNALHSLIGRSIRKIRFLPITCSFAAFSIWP